MKTKALLLIGMAAMPGLVFAAQPGGTPSAPIQSKRLVEADRKVEAGRILLKWGGYVEKVQGQSRKEWAAAMWPSLASADLDNLQKASQAVTYEGMRNALLGQRPYDEQVIDRMARAGTKSGAATKALGSLAADLVFTPITPCRIVDTRVTSDRLGAGATRNLDASNVGGNFTAQGGSNTNCGIPANPAALALSVTGLGNTTTGYLRVFPFNGTSAEGSPVPLNTINTTTTNDMIVPVSQGATQELKVFSTANTHYAAFVTGYFMAPFATALSTQLQLRTDDVASGVTLDFSIGCPVGYALTGGGCYSDDLYLIGNTDFGSLHYCKFRNLSGATQSART
ncbi:MAG: hypothetical protein EOP02_31445, partial [Proteobacteria bacterium]